MTWKGILRVGLVGLVLLGGFGCVKKLPIPVHTNLEPIQVEMEDDLDAVVFAGIAASMAQGTLIKSYDTGWSNEGYPCIHLGYMYWTGGSTFFKDKNEVISTTFYGTMKSLGYTVVGDPSNMFEIKEELARAKYKVGARLVDIKGNICKMFDVWKKMYTHRDSGEMYVKIDWSVYSNIKKKTVLRKTTTGYYQDPNGSFGGEGIIFSGAFANALENLTADQEFYDLVSRKKKDVGRKYTGPVGDVIRISKIRLFDDDFAQNVAVVNNAVVTIRTGWGHGSGFVISSDGYILTNNHVVGKADEVAVTFGQQVELVGKVIKRDPVRDVALIKVNLNRANALPLNLNGVKIAHDVYAIGSPQYEELNNTITKGVVSAVRFDPTMGIRLI